MTEADGVICGVVFAGVTLALVDALVTLLGGVVTVRETRFSGRLASIFSIVSAERERREQFNQEPIDMHTRSKSNYSPSLGFCDLVLRDLIFRRFIRSRRSFCTAFLAGRMQPKMDLALDFLRRDLLP